MARDLWLTRRLAPTVDRLPKFITLDAITANCGRTPNSINFLTTTVFKTTNNVDNPVTTAGTIEAWIYPVGGGSIGFSNNRIIFGEFNTGGSTPRFAIALKYTTGELLGYFDANVVASGIIVPLWKWSHVAISWDGTNARFFINGVFVATKPYAGPVTAGTIRVINGLGNAQTFPFYGYVGNLRIWDIALSDAVIAFKYNKRRDNGTVDAHLRSYFDCHETGAAIVSMADTVDVAFPATGTAKSNSSTIVPPLIYGASFVAAKWDVTLSNEVSLVWPIVPDDGTTGQLCVSWIDDDGIVQRRRLFTIDGVDIAPKPDLYDGEKLPANFSLELWNIDGAGTAILPNNFNIGISLCSAPQTSYDTTRLVETEPTIDTTLASNYSLAFPIVFNTQQVY